jgi:hypothetical protein
MKKFLNQTLSFVIAILVLGASSILFANEQSNYTSQAFYSRLPYYEKVVYSAFYSAALLENVRQTAQRRPVNPQVPDFDGYDFRRSQLLIQNLWLDFHDGSDLLSLGDKTESFSELLKLLWGQLEEKQVREATGTYLYCVELLNKVGMEYYMLVIFNADDLSVLQRLNTPDWLIDNFFRGSLLAQVASAEATRSIGGIGNDLGEANSFYERGSRLLSKIEEKSGNYIERLIVVDSWNWNAANGGGVLYLNAGLMKYLEEDGDLSYVLGHEVAHSKFFHHQKRLKGGLLAKIRKYLVKLVLVSQGVDPTASQLIELVYQMLELRYEAYKSQQHELEADFYGMLWSYQALDWDPYRADDIWESAYVYMKENMPFGQMFDEGMQGIWGEILNTGSHPLREQRLRKAEEFARAILDGKTRLPNDRNLIM